MPISTIARKITEDVFGGQPFEVGDVVRHPDGRMVEIVDGQYYGEHGFSNFWYWRPIKKDGTLGKLEKGYGWSPKRVKR